MHRRRSCPISWLFIFALLLSGTASPLAVAQDVFEAHVDREGPNQEGKRYSPPVRIVKLDDSERAALLEACGGDFKKLPGLAPKRTAAIPWYPYDMRRRGETASVKCLIEVDPSGKIVRIFRLGSDSDLFFVECARALAQWKMKGTEIRRFYRVPFSAGISLEPPRK